MENDCGLYRELDGLVSVLLHLTLIQVIGSSHALMDLVNTFLIAAQDSRRPSKTAYLL